MLSFAQMVSLYADVMSCSFFRCLGAALTLWGVSSAQAQDVRPLVEKAFTSCQLKLAPSGHLDLVAQAYARIGKVKPAAAEAKYAYQRMQGVRIPDIQTATQALKQRCAEFQNTIEYGVALYGSRGIAVVVADPKIPPGLQGVKVEGQLFLQATNAARKKGANCGGKWYPPAPPLGWDNRLFAAAQLYAQRLATLNFIGHIDPYTGASPDTRAATAGFRGAVGENLAHGANTAALAVKGLLTSPGHCRNMMNPQWKVMGGAYFASEKSDYGIHWVQLFGAP